MTPAEILSYVGAAAVPAAGFAWWALRLSWSAAKRDASIDMIGKELGALKDRVDEHDDLRERMARVEQAMHDVRGSLQRIELAVHARPA